LGSQDETREALGIRRGGHASWEVLLLEFVVASSFTDAVQEDNERVALALHDLGRGKECIGVCCLADLYLTGKEVSRGLLCRSHNSTKGEGSEAGSEEGHGHRVAAGGRMGALIGTLSPCSSPTL
jgi:hypothetical protein